MNAQFTPGPWEASLEAVRFVIQHVPEHGIGKRAIACTAGAEPANPFNAYLIAAAPELFEALEAIIGNIHPLGGHVAQPDYPHLVKARAALAKAKGAS